MKLIATVFLLFSGGVFAQNTIYNWSHSFGASNPDRGHSVAVDASENVFTTGYFFGTVDFDPGVGVENRVSNGQDDIFIQKLDPNGNLVWVNQIGGADDDEGRCVLTDPAGNLYVVGSFQGTANFETQSGTTSLTSNGGKDAFILKLDANGNLLWLNQIGGTATDYAETIALGPNGNVYVTGTFRNTVDFGSGVTMTATGASYGDAFVQKLDANGDMIWVRQIEGDGFELINSTAIDNSGNFFTAGYFSGTADFDLGTGTTNLTANSNGDIFIQKMDTDGNFFWAQQIGTPSSEGINSIAVDDVGNVYCAGTFYGTVDFDPGAGTENLTSNGARDIFIQKLDTNGDFQWAKHMGGPGTEILPSIALDADNNIFTTGIFGFTADFDPGSGTENLTSNGYEDIFIQKLDSNGDFLWVKQIGGSEDDYALDIATGSNENIYITGYFQETTDFNPGVGEANHTSNGNDEAFILKLGPCQTLYATDAQTACDSFDWIDGNTYNSDNNSASFMLSTGDGCDSLVTLDLTLNNSSSSTDMQTACGSYTWMDGNTYTSSNNSATYTLVNSVGCDSTITLNLIINNVSSIATAVTDFTITATSSADSYQWLDCNSGMDAIFGETNASFTATENGSYAVELTENGCTDTTECVVISTIGIVENTFSDEIIVSPNPNVGMFTIDFQSFQEALWVRLSTITGKVLSQERYEHVDVIQMTLDQPSGVYLLELMDDKGNSIKYRLLKE